MSTKNKRTKKPVKIKLSESKKPELLNEFLPILVPALPVWVAYKIAKKVWGDESGAHK